MDNARFGMHDNIGSVQSINASSTSSNQNSDDEDDTIQSQVAPNQRDRRRELHTQAEQKRRDAIKRGYDELFSLVHPTGECPEAGGSVKLSKATILQKSVNQIERLSNQKKQKDIELDRLRKEVVALKIMNANYEHIVKANQPGSNAGPAQVPDEVKFQVFQSFMDQLFHTFNHSVSVNSFAEASGCIINWLEEHCKPQCLGNLMESVLSQVLTQYQAQSQGHLQGAPSSSQIKGPPLSGYPPTAPPH